MERMFLWFSGLTAMVGITAGALALLGWILDSEILKSVVPGFVAMNPMTAVAFGLVGTALLLAGAESCTGRRRSFVAILAGGTILIAVMKVMNLLGMDFGIDQVLFTDKLAAYTLPNRMAPNTAMNFLLQGMALLFIDIETRRGRRPAQALPLLSGLVSTLAVVGYAYGVRGMYGITSYIPMALNTAVAFLLLDAGILCARPNRGIMRRISSSSEEGVMARRLLIGSFLVPLLLGRAVRTGARAGWYDWHFGLGLVVVASVIVLGALVWWTAGTVRRLRLEREKVAEDLIRKSRELEAVNAELESFSYSVSHDLQAPLRHVREFVSLLQEALPEESTPDTRRYMRVIAEGADRMKQLIADLLEFSRMGRTEMRRAGVRLDALAREVIGELSAGALNRSIEWKVDAVPMVEADAEMIRVVLTNLLGNAVKFTAAKERAVVELGCRAGQAELVFHVRDNGAGFDMKYADRLFGVFQRLHKVEEFPGLGIGLALVRRIIHRHGGRVWTEGTVGEGATFYFTLPRRPDHADAGIKPAPTGDSRSW
ncbi:MAG: hypothetical protein HYT87_10840 [Nitrospirae bacterium]|nr:hypothetical protein [Nitrospirota bacterium]